MQRRARHRGAARRGAALAGGRARQRGDAGVLRRLRARPRPAGRCGRSGWTRSSRPTTGCSRCAPATGAGATRTIVNATGTWSRPFVPAYPGAETFRGRQLHPHDYPGPEAFRGRRVVVVGGGASAVQLLGEIAPGRGRHALGDPARAGLAHRRLHPRGRPGGGRAGRGPGTPRAAAGQRRQRHRAGAARAGARGRAARRLRAAPDVRPPSSPTAYGCRTARTGRPT